MNNIVMKFLASKANWKKKQNLGSFYVIYQIECVKNRTFHKENFKLTFLISEFHQTLKRDIPWNLPRLFRKWNNRDDTHPHNFMGP